MRADRLISLLMLLQTHERMTATELSKELEVSIRTIYRDVIALNTAGIPIYTDRGPGGGIALLESYRTTLTGISEDEARALFMLSIPEALVELGVSQKLKAALLKLSVALPQSKRMVVEQTQQRIYLDSTAWSPSDGPGIHLRIIHQAVWQDKMLRLVYRGSFNANIELEMAPLGLVAKMNAWYLLGKTGEHIKVVRVRDIIVVQVLDASFTRDEKFNLEDAWAEWCRRYEESRSVYQVRVRVSPQAIPHLPFYLGETTRYTIADLYQGAESEWREMSISFENFFKARESILNLGRSVEVLEPEALRLSVIDFAKQIVDFYQNMQG